MSNFHRVAWVDERLRKNTYPTLRDIAERFEITSRQASRDIEYLRYSMGAPVEYSSERKGYYYSDNTYILPSGMITEDEKKTLSYLAHQYSKMGSEAGHRLADLFSRLTGEQNGECGDSGGVKAACIGDGEAQVFDILKRAIAARYSINLTYVNFSGDTSERIFDPYKLFVSGMKNYTAGYCHLKGEIRVFRLDRIRRAALTEASFEISPIYNEGDYKDDMSFNLTVPYAARIFTGCRLDENLLKLKTRLEGKDIYLINFNNSSQILTKLLSLNTKFEILWPKWLKSALGERLNEIFRMNFGQGHYMSYPPPYNESNQKSREVTYMGRKILEDIKQGMTWTSYISSTEGALSKAGMWEGETWKLMGMTGMSFHFIIHKELCPSSVTVYEWVNEHQAMMDRIGVHSDAYETFYDPKLNTYKEKHQDALSRIRESIDKGIPVVAWAVTPILEFGVIYGYDDEDKVFHVMDCTCQKVDPLLYDNLGKSEVPILFYQIFRSKVEFDSVKTYRESLQFGLSEWNKEFHINPSYASGKRAYQNLISALESGKFNDFGLAYILAVYSDSKKNIKAYLEYLDTVNGFKGLGTAAAEYTGIIERYDRLVQLVPFSGSNGSGCIVNKEVIPEVLKLAKECYEIEDKAMGLIAKIIG